MEFPFTPANENSIASKNNNLVAVIAALDKTKHATSGSKISNTYLI